MNKIELKVTMEPERLDVLRYFLSEQEKSTPEKNSSVVWMSCMKNMCRRTPAPIWITSVSRLRRGQSPGVLPKAVLPLRPDMDRWRKRKRRMSRPCECRLATVCGAVWPASGR